VTSSPSIPPGRAAGRPAAARCPTSTRAVPRRRATRRIASSAVSPDTPRNARPEGSTASSGTREASGLCRIERAGGRAGCAAPGHRSPRRGARWPRKSGWRPSCGPRGGLSNPLLTWPYWLHWHDGAGPRSAARVEAHGGWAVRPSADDRLDGPRGVPGRRPGAVLPPGPGWSASGRPKLSDSE